MSEVPAWPRYPDMIGRTSLAARCKGSAVSPGPVCSVAGSWRRYTPRANIVNSGESRSVPRGRGANRPATRAAPRRHIGRSAPGTARTNIHAPRANHLCVSSSRSGRRLHGKHCVLVRERNVIRRHSSQVPCGGRIGYCFGHTRQQIGLAPMVVAIRHLDPLGSAVPYDPRLYWNETPTRSVLRQTTQHLRSDSRPPNTKWNRSGTPKGLSTRRQAPTPDRLRTTHPITARPPRKTMRAPF